MGSYFSTLFAGLLGRKDVRILILGLDNAGKTTILYRLQLGDVVKTMPTISFNVESLSYKNIKFVMWDLGGQTSIRPYWRCYYYSTDAIIYVVDATDTDRMGLCKEELVAMLSEQELRDVPLIVFANKQDLDGALSDLEVANELGLNSLRSRPWQIFKTSALKGDGFVEDVCGLGGCGASSCHLTAQDLGGAGSPGNDSSEEVTEPSTPLLPSASLNDGRGSWSVIVVVNTSGSADPPCSAAQ